MGEDNPLMFRLQAAVRKKFVPDFKYAVNPHDSSILEAKMGEVKQNLE